jgi:flagellar protein FliS
MIEYSASRNFGAINRRAAFAYAETNVASAAPAASPHELIMMLLDGALAAIGQAQAHIASNNIVEKNAASSKALRILEEGLRASLDRANGGQIAMKLDSLYDYMTRRLLMANLKNDPAGFKEVGCLLAEIRAGWEGIAAAADTKAGRSPMAKQIQ